MNPIHPPGLPETCKPCWEEIQEIREAITRYETEREISKGVIRLPGWAMGLLWSIFVVVVTGILGGAIAVTRLEERMAEQSRYTTELQRQLVVHVGQPGHPGVIEKIQNIRDDLEELKKER